MACTWPLNKYYLQPSDTRRKNGGRIMLLLNVIFIFISTANKIIFYIGKLRRSVHFVRYMSAEWDCAGRVIKEYIAEEI